MHVKDGVRIDWTQSVNPSNHRSHEAQQARRPPSAFGEGEVDYRPILAAGKGKVQYYSQENDGATLTDHGHDPAEPEGPRHRDRPGRPRPADHVPVGRRGDRRRGEHGCRSSITNDG